MAPNKTNLTVHVIHSMLKYYVNTYNDVVVKDSSIPVDWTVFGSELDVRLVTWRRIGHSAVWLKLPNWAASHAPTLFQRGFKPHHCGADYIMYTLWLKTGTPSKLPEYGTHVVRVEALLRRPDGRLLMVQERHGARHWKFVSGAVDRGEHIVAAVVREVAEEVGLKTNFMGIAGVANRTGAKWGRNELVVLCQVNLTDKQDPDALKLQDDEIAKAAWFSPKDVQLYWNLDFTDVKTMTWDLVRAFTSDGFMHSHTLAPCAAACAGTVVSEGGDEDASRPEPDGGRDTTDSRSPSYAGAGCRWRTNTQIRRHTSHRPAPVSLAGP